MKSKGFIPKIKTRSKRGFTIVEMLVSVTIFVIAIAISSNFFLSAIKAQRRALADQQIISQASYALEYMSRSLRMARKDMDGSCTGQQKLNYKEEETPYGIKFEDYKGDCRRFFLEDNQIKQDLGGEVLPLTYNNLEVVDFNIEILGETQDDNLQPRVTLFLNIKSIGGGNTKKFQTTISQRNLDVYK